MDLLCAKGVNYSLLIPWSVHLSYLMICIENIGLGKQKLGVWNLDNEESICVSTPAGTSEMLSALAAWLVQQDRYYQVDPRDALIWTRWPGDKSTG